MSSGSGRAILIVVAIAFIAGGAGYYFVKVYRPHQVLRDAQDEIEGWEARWKAARTCLLGPTPGSSKTSEALAIRELSPDPWDRGGCTPLIAKLSRGDAPDSGLPEVERAWSELDTAAGRAAQAFAKHVGSSTTLIDDPLPAALDVLDASRMSLRVAASLTVDEDTGKPLAAVTVLPIQDGSEPFEQLDIAYLPSAHGVLLSGRTANRIVQATIPAGGTPKLARLGPGAMRAVPDPSWGGAPLGAMAAAGALDVEGAMAAPKQLDKLSNDPDEHATVVAAIGSLDDGEIVYGAPGHIAIAHLHAGTATTKVVATLLATVGTDLDGRAALVWSTPDQKAHAQMLRAAGDGPVIDLPEPAIGQPCLTGDRAWVTSSNSVIGFGVDPTVVVPSRGMLIGCTNEGAIVREGDLPQRLLVCTADCRPTTMPTGAPERATLALVAGKLVAIAEHGGVLGVWREDGKKTFFALPETAHLVMANEWPTMALTDGKVIDVIARGTKTYVVIRLPITAGS
jgi:hypothetical protein